MPVLRELRGELILDRGIVARGLGMCAEIIPKEKRELLRPAPGLPYVNVRARRPWRLAEVALGSFLVL